MKPQILLPPAISNKSTSFLSLQRCKQIVCKKTRKCNNWKILENA